MLKVRKRKNQTLLIRLGNLKNTKVPNFGIGGLFSEEMCQKTLFLPSKNALRELKELSGPNGIIQPYQPNGTLGNKVVAATALRNLPSTRRGSG